MRGGWGGGLDPGRRTSSHRACDQTILWRCRPRKLTAGETNLSQGNSRTFRTSPWMSHRQLKLNRSKQKPRSDPELALPSSGDPHLSDPDAQCPPIKAKKWESLETHLCHPALDLQTAILESLGSYPHRFSSDWFGGSLGIGTFIFNSPGVCNAQPSLRTPVDSKAPGSGC